MKEIENTDDIISKTSKINSNDSTAYKFSHK